MKNNHLLIFNTLLINALLFYLSVFFKGSHEGTDSWDYIQICSDIVEKGNASWQFSVLSFFGYYSPEQEIGILYLYSASEIVSGLNQLQLSLWISYFLNIISVGIFFILFKEIFKDKQTAFWGTILLNFANKHVSDMVWHISLRESTVIFGGLSLFLYSRFILNDKFNFRFLVLFIFSLFILFSTHRISIFIIPVLLLLRIATINKIEYILKYSPKINAKPILTYSFIIVFNLVLLYFSYFYLSTIEFGPIDNDDSIIQEFISKSISHSINLGLVSVLIPLSLIHLFFNSDKKNIRFILIFLISLCSLTYFDDVYFAKLFYFIFCAIIAYFISNYVYSIKLGKRKPLIHIMISSLLFLSFFFPALASPYNLDSYVEGFKSEERYSTAFFIRDFTAKDESFYIHGYGSDANSIHAISELQYMNEDSINYIKNTTTLEFSPYEFIREFKLYKSYISDRRFYSEDYNYEDPRISLHIKDLMIYTIVNPHFGSQEYSDPHIELMGDPRVHKFIESSTKNSYKIYSTRDSSTYFINYYD